MPPSSDPVIGRDDVALGQVLRKLRPHALSLLLATGLVTASMSLHSRGQPPTYESTASVIAFGGNTRGASLGDVTATAPALPPGAVEEVVHSPGVVEDTVARLGGQGLGGAEVGTLAAGLRAELRDREFTRVVVRSRIDQQQRGVYELVARAGTPEAARALAQASAEALLAWDAGRARARFALTERSLEGRLRDLDRRLSVLGPASPESAALAAARDETAQNLAQVGLLRSGAAGTLALAGQPVAPQSPVAPRPARDAALAGFLMLVAGSGVVLLVGALRRRVRTPDDLRSLGVPVLGKLPRLPRRAVAGGLLSASRAGPVQAELGFLRLRLLPLLARAGQPRLVVCGALPGQGASSVVAALAEHCAAVGLRVLVIDAGRGQAAQHRLWPLAGAPRQPLPGGGAPGDAGVTALTLAQACRNPGAALAARVAPGVDLLPADDGPAPAIPLPQAGLAALLDRWAAGYDLVLIDAPPLLDRPDALSIAPATAGVLLVADARAARLPDLERALTLSRATGVAVLGVVLTKLSGPEVPPPHPEAQEAPERERALSG